MSSKHWLLVALFLIMPASAASAQETNKTEPEVEKLIANLNAMDDEKTWPYKKLSDRADVVVIGTFEKRVVIEHDLSNETEFSNRSTTNLTTLVSTFTLNAVIKGDIKNKSIDVCDSSTMGKTDHRFG